MSRHLLPVPVRFASRLLVTLCLSATVAGAQELGARGEGEGGGEAAGGELEDPGPDDSPAEFAPEDQEADKLPFRGSQIWWVHSATTQTLGVGGAYQSANPTYYTSLVLRPRYYFIDREEYELSLRADFALTREMTNSDTTTERGEVDTSDVYGLDPRVAFAHSMPLYERGEYATGLSLLLPDIFLPTSKVSRRRGKILGLGARVYPSQTVPLGGKSQPWVRTLTFRGILGYTHNFYRTQTPEVSDLDRVWTTLDGLPTPAAQIGGGAATRDYVLVGLSGTVSLHERADWTTTAVWYPAWSYPISDAEPVCGVVVTGCVEPTSTNDPQTFGVSTAFQTELSVKVFDVLGVAAGYENTASQIGPDGRRRAIFYSPDARFSLSFIVNLDELYGKSGAVAPRHAIRSGGAVQNSVAVQNSEAARAIPTASGQGAASRGWEASGLVW